MRSLRAALLAAVLLLAGCGGGHHAVSAPPACPGAAGGHGTMGGCTPPSLKRKALTTPQNASLPSFPDRSNNDPVFNTGPIRSHGHVGLVAKANQGTGFIDSTFVPMIRNARAHGLAVGGYDFVSSYTAAEAYVFINRLRAAGIWEHTPNTFPPTLDVEYGNFSLSGLRHMVDIMLRTYGRVQIYTGAWYWQPRAGCFWFTHANGWLAGYPSAPRLCGMPTGQYVAHQYTDRGFDGIGLVDMSVYLGRSFSSYVQKAKPKPPGPDPRLKGLYAYRAKIRVLLQTRGCRRRAAAHQSLGPKCRVWFKHGLDVNARIRQLGGR